MHSLAFLLVLILSGHSCEPKQVTIDLKEIQRLAPYNYTDDQGLPWILKNSVSYTGTFYMGQTQPANLIVYLDPFQNVIVTTDQCTKDEGCQTSAFNASNSSTAIIGSFTQFAYPIYGGGLGDANKLSDRFCISLSSCGNDLRLDDMLGIRDFNMYSKVHMGEEDGSVNIPSIIPYFQEQGFIQNQVFSMYFSKNQTSQLTFGGYLEILLQPQQPVVWTNCSYFGTNPIIDISDIISQNQSIPQGNPTSGGDIIFDPADQFIYGNLNVFYQLKRTLNEALSPSFSFIDQDSPAILDLEETVAFLPNHSCSEISPLLEPLKFKIGGFWLTLEPTDYLIDFKTQNQTNICYFAIKGRYNVGYSLSLGTAFLNQYMTIFDLESKKVGFALPIGSRGTITLIETGYKMPAWLIAVISVAGLILLIIVGTITIKMRKKEKARSDSNSEAIEESTSGALLNKSSHQP